PPDGRGPATAGPVAHPPPLRAHHGPGRPPRAPPPGAPSARRSHARPPAAWRRPCSAQPSPTAPPHSPPPCPPRREAPAGRTTHSSSSSYQPPNRVTSNVYTRLPVHAQSRKCSNTAQPRRADTHSASTCAHASTPSTHASPALSSAGPATCLTRRVGTPSTAPAAAIA